MEKNLRTGEISKSGIQKKKTNYFKVGCNYPLHTVNIGVGEVFARGVRTGKEHDSDYIRSGSLAASTLTIIEIESLKGKEISP